MEEYNDTERGHNNHGESERKRGGEQVKQVIIPNTQSSSFFQDTEIRVHKSAEAMAMTQAKKKKIMVQPTAV